MIQILVVDDEDGFREGIAQYFRTRMKWEVLTAKDSYEAIDQIDKHRKTLTGIVLDRRMPDRSGILQDTGDEVVEWLYRQRLSKRICLVMLTAFSDKDIATKTLNRGGWHFLTKPCGPDDLLRLLSPGLAHRRSQELHTWALNGPELRDVVKGIGSTIQETLSPNHFSVYMLLNGTTRNLTTGQEEGRRRLFMEKAIDDGFLYVDTREEAQQLEALDEKTGSIMAVRIDAFGDGKADGVVAMESALEGAFDPRWQDVLEFFAQIVATAMTVRKALDVAMAAEQTSVEMVNRELKHRFATSLGTMFHHIDLLESDLAALPRKEPMLAKTDVVKRHLRGLANVMRELGKVTQRQPKLETKPLDPRPLIKSVLSESHLPPETLRDEFVGKNVLANSEELRYCLRCLVANALEAVEARSKIIAPEIKLPDGASFDEMLTSAQQKPLREILVTIREGKALGTCEIAVHDEGIGFDSQIADRLFNPLFTTKLRSDAGDHGIGLYSTRRILSAMDGSIGAHSNGENKGADFVVTLKAAPEQA